MVDFGDFYLSRKDAVLRAVLAATADRAGAEDAVAEAFARAYSRWAKVREHPNPAGWVVLTALNVRRSWWRRWRRELLSDAPPEPPANVAENGLSDQMRSAVLALPRRQREVVALRVLCGFAIDEVGEILGIAPATVHVHLHRALAALRNGLGLAAQPAGAEGKAAR
ncbi:RNA polymerase [Rhizocola hellebori]|uniref:RNA polymerase n=1 Tax=Rhizocola hellebori TaxID=1392758 RepID=A0A8J3VJ07_9ACTN|nr:sigma-70 family RNA polymerase sigma factor [Rhizocola hellebori]GIH07947.1 RNA polymerase [Rhizocola hellebori]